MYVCMYELDILQYLIESLFCAMKLHILLHISLSLQCWIMFYDSFRTLQYIIWYIFLLSSYVEQFLLLEPTGVVCCVLLFNYL
jgi:hypothetical protein